MLGIEYPFDGQGVAADRGSLILWESEEKDNRIKPKAAARTFISAATIIRQRWKEQGTFPLHRTLSSSQQCSVTFINCACRLTADEIFFLSPLSPLFPSFGAANAQHGEDKHSVKNGDRTGDRRAVHGVIGPKRRVH